MLLRGCHDQQTLVSKPRDELSVVASKSSSRSDAAITKSIVINKSSLSAVKIKQLPAS